MASLSCSCGMLLALLLLAAPAWAYYRPEEMKTQKPVIGVITLPVTVPSQLKYGTHSFAVSYVRWLEAGGARVVPIFYNSSPEQLDYLLARVNGVFFTGGLVEFNPSYEDPTGAHYLRTTSHILRHVVESSMNGDYFPLWGTCLGFERTVQWLAHDVNATLLDEYDAENLDISLNFTIDGWESRLFSELPDELFREVSSPLSHLAFNNHGLGFDPERFSASNAANYLKVLSVDRDRNGRPFVSTVEGSELPLYGSQWHPEKAPWEWSPKMRIDHTSAALQLSGALGRFFVSECKYSGNKFASEAEVEKYLIYNWQPQPTGDRYAIRSAYTQIYFFSEQHPAFYGKSFDGELVHVDDNQESVAVIEQVVLGRRALRL
eukprot:jgi/Chlat1/9275/Chrsp99S08537